MCIRDRVVVGRLAEVRFVDVNTGIILSTHNVPYGSTPVSYTHLSSTMSAGIKIDPKSVEEI